MTDAVSPLDRRDPWSLQHIEPLAGTTLYDHVTALLPANGRGPVQYGGEPLPDEPELDPTSTSMSLGAAFEGVLAHRGPGSQGSEPLTLAAALIALLRQPPTTVAVHAFVRQTHDLDGPQAMDRFLHAVGTSSGLDPARLAALGRWLCTRGVQPGQVKVGLALLGTSGDPDDAQLVTRLGLLDRLTLYSLVALQNLLPQPERAVFDLAQQVGGWGRIHALYRLNGSTDPEVRRWMLYGGYETGVMTEEVAFVVATTGRLAQALRNDDDDALLDHAGELLQSLALGGPAEDMSDYAEGREAMAAYLRRLMTAEASLPRLGHLDTLERYLREWATDNTHLSDAERADLLAHAGQVLHRSEWRAVAESALRGNDVGQLKASLALAGRFGLDAVPVVRDWLPRAPEDGYLWQFLLNRADVVEMRRLLPLAHELLRLGELPPGPALEHGLGPGFRRNTCLQLILQRLRDFPGEGADTIRVGLSSPVIGTRNTALRAWARWPDRDGSDEFSLLVAQMAWSDPDESVRKRARDLSR